LRRFASLPSVTYLELPAGTIKSPIPAKPPAPKASVKKVARKSSPNAGNLRAAKKNIKAYLKMLEDTRSKFAIWLDPSSKNKTIGMRLQKKLNPEKVLICICRFFVYL
jgi:hypothetical protein